MNHRGSATIPRGRWLIPSWKATRRHYFGPQQTESACGKVAAYPHTERGIRYPRRGACGDRCKLCEKRRHLFL